MDTQISPRRRRSKQQIQDLLHEFKKSNTTVKDFCNQHSINACNFHKWKSRYKNISFSKKKTSGFATLAVIDSMPVLPALFAEVKGIRIYQPVSASFLKEFLA
ncbi:MAG: transposase [Flavisolibacter sp.]|nr:transposase [Flavisolibacter sp.]